MKAFSRFTPLPYDTNPDVRDESDVSNWFQIQEDEKFRLSLKQTREELREAIRYKQAFEFLIEEVKSISEGRELPLAKERRLAACLKIVKKNWPDLS